MSAPASYTYAGLGEALARAVVGGTTTLYASTPEGPLAQEVGSTVRYYARDQHGDTVGWTDTTGTLKGTALYDPLGAVLSATGEMATVAQGAVGFRSDLTDASTGQVDMGVRAYEPTLGRLSTPDPLFGHPADPISLNRFTYAVGNPITLSDPTGLMPVCGEGCTRQEEAETIRGYATAFTQTGASEYSPALDQPGPPPAITYYTVMRNERLPMDQRIAAAGSMIADYGEQGRGIVEEWLGAMELESEASIWSQIVHHPFSSYEAGQAQVPNWVELTGWGMIAVGGGLVCQKVDLCASIGDKALGLFARHQQLPGASLAQNLAVQEASSGVGARTIVESNKLRAVQDLVARYGGSEWVPKSGSVHWDRGTAFQAHWFEETKTGMQVGWHFRPVYP